MSVWEPKNILRCGAIQLSSSGPCSHILNGQTSRRETQKKGTRADAIIQTHPPPTFQTNSIVSLSQNSDCYDTPICQDTPVCQNTKIFQDTPVCEDTPVHQDTAVCQETPD